MDWFLDIETRSQSPITGGTYRYAEESEVLLVAIGVAGNVDVWDRVNNPAGVGVSQTFARMLADTGPIYAHNAAFEAAHFPSVDPARWRCTMAQALSHGLPASLAALSSVLGLESDAKDTDGKRLIQLFCVPDANGEWRGTAATHPAEWEQFVAYCRQDVVALQALVAKLPAWNYPAVDLDVWQLDQAINRRGFLVDVDLATGAVAACKAAQSRLARDTETLTVGEVASATQRAALLVFIESAYGWTLPDLTGGTVDSLLRRDDMPRGLRELLEARAQASKSSTAKYGALLRAVCRDGRLRGGLQYCGAARTGRWSGRLFQPQNLPRPTLKPAQVELAVATLTDGTADMFFADVMEAASSALRGCIVAPPGMHLAVADLANIEGRVLAWLAGEDWKLAAFRAFDAGTGPDLYALAYAKSFGVTPDAVMENKAHGDGTMRQVGKVQELALGYQGGVGAFVTFAQVYGIDLDALATGAVLPPDLLAEAEEFLAWCVAEKRPTHGLAPAVFVACDAVKRGWRYAHPATVQMWKSVANAVATAVEFPGYTVDCGHLRMAYTHGWLAIRLPSGRRLSYPGAQLEPDGSVSYMGVDQYTRKWQRLRSYGGKWVENIVQGVARDVLAHGLLRCQAAGYTPVLTVHDEIITESHQGHAGLCAVLATVPAWAPGLPLAAEGFTATRYKK